MRETGAFFLSWIAVTCIFSAALVADGVQTSISHALEALRLVVFVGVVALGYLVIFGLPPLLFLMRNKHAQLKSFVLTGLAACIPIFMFSVLAKEIEFIIASVVSGGLSGYLIGKYHIERART